MCIKMYIWINEELFCRRDRCNHHDPFAVATCRDSNVVGHVHREISAICYVFLGKPGMVISCTVTGSRRYSCDLPQGGLEIRTMCPQVYRG